MDPVTLAAISIGATAAGSATAAGGSIMAGIGGWQQAKYQAGVADVNRRIALQNADYARAVGESKAVESGMRTRAQVGETLARQGGGGLDVNTGSAAAVRESEGILGRYDQAVIRANAAKTAYGYEVEAMQDTAQGQLFRAAGTQSLEQGFIGAGSSILGGAGSVSSKWLQAGQMGVPGFTNPAPNPYFAGGMASFPQA